MKILKISTENNVWKLIKELEHKNGITEIVINGPDNVFVERNGHFIQIDSDINTEDIWSFVKDVVPNPSSPFFNGKLPQGERINIVLTPVVKDYPAITIRRYEKKLKSFDDEKNIFGLNPFWIKFLRACISARMNIIVSGGTGVGKTTFLNLLLNEILPSERILTIEDLREVSAPTLNWVSMQTFEGESSITMRECVKNSLRMRPDRIIIGEVRGGEIFDLLQSMNTGHEGSMTSIHANNTKECIQRVEALFLLSGFDVPLIAVRRQIVSAVDFVIQLGKDINGRRIVTQISEITGMEGSSILFSSIGSSKGSETLKFDGIAPSNIEKLHQLGGLPLNFFA